MTVDEHNYLIISFIVHCNAKYHVSQEIYAFLITFFSFLLFFLFHNFYDNEKLFKQCQIENSYFGEI